MAKEPGPWVGGRQAWSRLKGWLPQSRSDTAGTTDGAEALSALSDVGHMRRLLDHAERAAVRAARSGGVSWAEIATRLGVTRQSAWERWREVDVVPFDTDTRKLAAPRPGRPNIRVPNVIGLAGDRALRVLAEKGLSALGASGDGPPTMQELGADAVVTDQSPESGARVAAGSAVRLWIERRGDGGVREPRRPTPKPLSGRAIRDERSNEAVG